VQISGAYPGIVQSQTMRMQRMSAAAAGQTFFVCLCLLWLPATTFAFSGTFKGFLVPLMVADTPIPIVIEIEETYGRFSGSAKTSAPFTGGGEITSGLKRGDTCEITTKLAEHVRLRLEGVCRSLNFDGKYSLFLANGERRQGTFRLNRDTAAEKKKGPSEDDRRKRAVSMTTCIRTNSQCLALCPRGETNAEFVCVNGCRRKLASCKARAKGSKVPPPEAFD
jgi:hypothetical protein